jgi:hypothetical protein
MVRNSELEGMCEELVEVYFKILTQYSHGRSKTYYLFSKSA